MKVDIHDLDQLASESRRKRGKKKGSARSQMLRMIMPMLSGADGEALQNAISNNDPEAAQRAMQSVTKKLHQKLEDRKGK